MIDIPVVIEREAGYSLGRSSANHMANTEGDRQLFLLTVTPIAALESPVNHTCMCLDCWSKVEYPKGFPCNMHALNRKAPPVQQFQRRHSAIIIVI